MKEMHGFNLKKRASEISNIIFSGVWNNTLGSSMVLNQSGNSITGKYTTAVGAPGENEEFDLIGFASGDLTTFCVNFGSHGSLTSWAGQHIIVDNKEIIKTQWLLAKNIKDEDEPEWLWSATLVGGNEFTKE